MTTLATRSMTSSTASPCPPRWATPRTNRPTLGPRVAAVAEKLGTPLMPWQQRVVDTALEINPATRRFVYRQVTLTVPRQSGKTTLILALAVHRALGMGSPQRIVYTAQTRLDARKKWEDDQLPMLAASPFAGHFRARKTTGNEAFIWGNGSQHGIMSVTKKSGHGPTIDLAIIDEAFAQDDSRLEQSTKPSMITRPQPQLWVVSTAGDESSVFLRSKVDAGRMQAEAGMTRGNAYFEWSAPEKADPEDPDVWRACMPALGRTVTEEAIRADYDSMSSEGKLGEFRRAYLNQWLDAIPDEWLVIPQESWVALHAPPVAHGEVALAVDSTPKKIGGTIAAAWRRPDGHMDVEIVEHRGGTSWLPKRLQEIVRDHRPIAVVIDPAGPAGPLIDEIETLGIEVTKPTMREMAQGCGRFFNMVMDSRTLRHGNDADLNAAVAGAVRRDLGDAWAWARKATNVDISPLVGVTLAAWAHDKFATRSAPYDLTRSVG